MPTPVGPRTTTISPGPSVNVTGDREPRARARARSSSAAAGQGDARLVSDASVWFGPSQGARREKLASARANASLASARSRSGRYALKNAPAKGRTEGAGEVVGGRGPAGVGKATLRRPLLGLETALSGNVYYAGISLAGEPAGPVNRPFAWVPQDAPLLHATLDQNVTLGDPDVRPAETLAALGASRLADKLGTSQLVAERALSGGERQWIALARAMATRQPVLLLDEPTSGLDPGSQRMVLSAIASLRGKRSVLLITHRSEPAETADRVLVLG